MSNQPAPRKKDRSIWILFLILVVVAIASIASNLWRPAERIPWRGDMSSARAEAQADKKPMLLYFTADWCGPCQSLKRTTWADKNVESTLASFVPVKIDIDENPDLAMRYRVQAVPYFVLQGADDQPIKVATGAMDSSTFIQWLTQ